MMVALAQPILAAEQSSGSEGPVVPSLGIPTGPSRVQLPIDRSQAPPLSHRSSRGSSIGSDQPDAEPGLREPEAEPTEAEDIMAQVLALNDKWGIHDGLAHNPFAIMVQEIADLQDKAIEVPKARDLTDLTATIQAHTANMQDGRYKRAVGLLITHMFQTGDGISIGLTQGTGTGAAAASSMTPDRPAPDVYTLNEFPAFQSTDGKVLCQIGTNIKKMMAYLNINPYKTGFEDPRGSISICPPNRPRRRWFDIMNIAAAREPNTGWVIRRGTYSPHSD